MTRLLPPPDGIGPEIVVAMREIVEAAAEAPSAAHRVEAQEIDVAAPEGAGVVLPDAVAVCRRRDPRPLCAYACPPASEGSDLRQAGCAERRSSATAQARSTTAPRGALDARAKAVAARIRKEST